MKRQDSGQVKKEQLQLNVMEKALRFSNQLIPDLHRALLIPLTEKETASLIEAKINDNLYLFLEFMENYDPPFPNFLNMVVELHLKLSPDTFTKLFARVCAQYRGRTSW